jgi:hypothetical protein
VNTAVESPAIRVARDAAVDVIRGQVLRVAALVRKSDPQSEALSQRLLAPIVNWREDPREGQREGRSRRPRARPRPAAAPIR